MVITVFGLGYVGAVVGACFSRDGHEVIGVDNDPTKTELIQQGRSPIMEPGLAELIAENVAAGRLRATASCTEAVAASTISLICVGTPSLATGELNLAYVQRVCEEIGAAMAQKSERHIVVVRSTMLPGSVAGTVIPALEKASGLRCGEGFGIAINPEFLRESSAIHDFDHPPKTVIGARDRADAEKIAALYEKLDAPLFLTSLETAEMVKYTDNAFHAVKVTFANEIGALAKSCGIDGREVLEIFCADRKLNISPAYLRPGFAYGGSCLPKDLRALTRMAQNCGVTLPMLNALSISNTEQIQRATERVLREGRPVVAVLGFAFKGGTDDLRESPVVTLVESLIGKGLDLRLFDRNVSLARLIGANRRFIEERIPHISRLMVNEAAAACEGADVVVVGNESAEHWEVLRTLDPRQKVIDLTPAKPGIETPAQYERISS